MAYNKTTWQNGDIVSATKLNNIENGIETLDSAHGGLVVTETEGQFDHTWSEINTALRAGKNVCLIIGSVVHTGCEVFINNGSYVVKTGSGLNPVVFETDSADGYPIQGIS